MSPVLEGFGANERALFDVLALAWFRDEPMTVKRAIELEHLGSRATLHKRVTCLRQLGLLAVVNKDGDRKTKYLVPSSEGLAYLGKLNQAILKP